MPRSCPYAPRMVTQPPSSPGFWNEDAQVERFASRDADHRLVALMATHADPARVRVLDLGCAGGRNAALLAERGYDVFARDLAPAMVARTRERVAAHLGVAEAERRVRVAAMDALTDLPDGRFDLIVALGIYHQAQSEAEWARALDESVRVAAPGALLLVSTFAPGTGALDAPVARIEGTSFVYEGLRGGHLCLRTLEDLDADFEARGCVPETPSVLVQRETEDRRRVTVNALYRRLTA